MEHCPCGSLKNDHDCCRRFISGNEIPATPEDLMRSRYTAFTEVNMQYIERTMKSPAADKFHVESAREQEKRVKWLKLEVIKSSVENGKGFVEFLAYFSENNKQYVLHELSEFHKIDGIWYYVNGHVPTDRPPIATGPRVGRNEPCSCGSGKKYKKCCGGISSQASC